ncbi:MAG: transposase [Gammaproteobacteria bacterium]
MQQWFAYSDPGMEEALHDMPLLRELAGWDACEEAMPDKTTTFRFRRLLEKHPLASALFSKTAALLAEPGCRCAKGRWSMRG